MISAGVKLRSIYLLGNFDLTRGCICVNDLCHLIVYISIYEGAPHSAKMYGIKVIRMEFERQGASSWITVTLFNSMLLGYHLSLS